MLPQADDAASWTPQIPGGEPWPPEPWQPDASGQRQAWRYDPSGEERPQPPADERALRPWAEQAVEQPADPERPRKIQSEVPADPERPWAEPPDERAQAVRPADLERPWSEPPGERAERAGRATWSAPPGDPERPWAEPPDEQATQQVGRSAFGSRPPIEQPVEQPAERPVESPAERPWPAPADVERPWAAQPGESEHPWAARPARTVPADPERPWAAQPGESERPWAGRPAEQSMERPWAEQPTGQQARPWAEQGQPWNAPRQPETRQPETRQPWDDGRRPPPPRRPEAEQWLPDDGGRWRGPLVAGLVAALLTAALVVGYVFFTKNGDEGGERAAPITTSQSKPKDKASDAPKDDEQPPDESSGDAKTEATAVDAVLSDMTDSRKKLESITYSCANKSDDIKTFKTAVSEREEQLAEAEDLEVGALDNGADLKASLTEALQASIDANSEAIKFLEDEDGCDGDPATRLKEWNDKAGKAKTKFLGLWNAIADEHGLPERKRETI